MKQLIVIFILLLVVSVSFGQSNEVQVQDTQGIVLEPQADSSYALVNVLPSSEITLTVSVWYRDDQPQEVRTIVLMHREAYYIPKEAYLMFLSIEGGEPKTVYLE